MSLTRARPLSTKPQKWSAVTVLPRDTPFRSGVSNRTSPTPCSRISCSISSRPGAFTGRKYATGFSGQPASEVVGHERVVGELRIAPVDAVDLRRLARAQILRGVEAPAALEQALAPQDLVAAGDDAVEGVRDV